MNQRQKLVQQQFLNNEEAVISRLKYIYDSSLFEINDTIRNLEFRIGDLTEKYDWMDDTDPDKEKVKSMIQSKIYQKKYQEALQGQLDGILKEMKTKQFLTISDYLDACYEEGFVGSIFDLHGQGVPLMIPLDQTKMVRAVQLESKISKGLYTRLGEDVDVLKKKITSQVTRSVATGSSYAQTAQQIAGQTNIGMNNAIRIARTEGHRIQTTAAMDVMEAAKAKGADVVKQWDATLDGRTRESHQAVDGEIREVDEPFSNGLMFPGDPAGGAGEVVNCRCALLQRARWALDDDFTKMDNISGELVEIKAKDYDTFKKQYFEKAKDAQKAQLARKTDAEQFERYRKVLGKNAPKTLDAFQDLKYNNSEQWDVLKYQYRTVNRYEVDGNVTADKILELDEVAFYEKKKGFDYSSYSGKHKKKLMKDISNGGNAATMEFDGKVYFSHSKFGLPGTLEHGLYKGKYPTVTLAKDRIFDVKDLGDGIPRQFDTEAKFLEFVASKKNAEDKFTVTILSEKHICESCQGVVEQFKQKFPNSTVNIVSGKKGYNGSEEGLHTWKHRKKVK